MTHSRCGKETTAVTPVCDSETGNVLLSTPDFSEVCCSLWLSQLQANYIFWKDHLWRRRLRETSCFRAGQFTPVNCSEILPDQVLRCKQMRLCWQNTLCFICRLSRYIAFYSFYHFFAAQAKPPLPMTHRPSWPGRTGQVRWGCGCGCPAPWRRGRALPSIGNGRRGRLCPELRLTPWAWRHDVGLGRLQPGGEPAAAPRTWRKHVGKQFSLIHSVAVFSVHDRTIKSSAKTNCVIGNNCLFQSNNVIN